MIAEGVRAIVRSAVTEIARALLMSLGDEVEGVLICVATRDDVMCAGVAPAAEGKQVPMPPALAARIAKSTTNWCAYACNHDPDFSASIADGDPSERS